ncbi:MAG: ORF6N domain-containing protein [Candidatus Jacksonbacteria bacterium]
MARKQDSNITTLSTNYIASKIYFIRGRKVMIDKDLAMLYEVETKQLKRQVKRNIERFPADFMLELTMREYQNFLRRQFGILKRGKHAKYRPYAFTEQGVAMLSSVLRSRQAIHVNIQIMRAFTQLRTMLMAYSELKKKIEEMESKYDRQFKKVFEAIKQLIIQKEEPRAEIGFR